ncbi:MAG: hypothetical protein V4529_16925 [Gemmatimonadota bacterium]
MTVCSYGNYDGIKRSRRCCRTAQFVAEVSDGRLRQFCSHHAAIMEALGWKVYNVMRPGQWPRYDEQTKVA